VAESYASGLYSQFKSHEEYLIYSQISLVRYRFFGRAYYNTNGIVILRVIYKMNK